MKRVMVVVVFCLCPGPSAVCEANQPAWQSHPPMRALPVAGKRPLADGPTYFVHATEGSDEDSGSQDAPWRSLPHALARLKAGDTLVLRGGVHYAQVRCKLRGTQRRPITIRAFPGELAIVDGGVADFFQEPANAWQPIENGGAAGEYRSRKAHPNLGEVVLGNFGDSLVPLHGYRNLIDLRSDNEYWNIGPKLGTDKGIYCGPGIWYDGASGHLHARLAPTRLAVLGKENNYGGQADPRKLKLVICRPAPVLAIEGAAHVRIEDLVLRGSSRSTVRIADSQHVHLDGVTIYGGSPAIMVQGVDGLKVAHCAVRGISAPWSFRSSLKYRGVAAYLLTIRGDGPVTRNVEIAHCELTDSHDGPFIGTAQGVKFHHNLVENFNDDGVYLTAMGKGGDVQIYQNYISRCLHAFSFFGEYQTGSGVQIYRNVIDLRSPVHYFQPSGPDDERFAAADGKLPRWPFYGRLCGDHGGPVWEPIRFYHNTVATRTPAFRNYYAAGWGGHTRDTSRQVFNNIFLQIEGLPGLNFASAEDDVQADGNLHWSADEEQIGQEKFFAALRASKTFEASKAQYEPGWASHDVYAFPRLTSAEIDWNKRIDARLRSSSPAVNTGREIPDDWPDPLRESDKGPPDIGALPLGAPPFTSGLTPSD